MKPLLLLPQKHRPDDADLWRAAIRLGWDTLRVGTTVDREAFAGRPMIRYYGNGLHALQLRGMLPVSFTAIDPAFLPELSVTRRSISLQPFAAISVPFAKATFVKPVSEKWFPARVYSVGETLPEGPLPDDLAYVQSPVTFTDEVRCFVRGDEILTAGLYRVAGVPWDTCGLEPEALNYDDRIQATPIPDYVREIRARAGTRLPEGVVMDFGQLASGEWALIEFNEAWASGLYYCDPQRALDVIVVNQTSPLADVAP